MTGDTLVECEVQMNGAVVFFTLGGDSDYDMIEVGFEHCGLSKYIPNKNTSAAALKSALVKTWGNRRMKIDSLEGKRGGFAVAQVKGDVQNDVRTLDYEVLFTTEVPSSSQFIPFFDPSTGDAIEPTKARECRGKFWDELKKVPAQKVSLALTQIIQGPLKGIRLRETGGIYWIPESSLKIWRSLSFTLSEASTRNKLYKMCTSIDVDSIEAICDALTSSVEAEMEKLTEEIISGDLKQERAYVSRRNRAVELRAKVKDYEKIFGKTLDNLTSQCEETDVAAAAAVLATFGA